MRTLGRLREAYEEHQDFVLLAILFTAFRFMSLLLYRPGGFILEWSGFYLQDQGAAELSNRGLYPFIHYWIEYPPLFPWLAVAAHRLSLLIPPWVSANFWFNLLLGMMLLPFEVGNFILLYAIALKVYGRDQAVRCGWLYAGLFAPIFIFLGWLDNFPLFFLLLALYLVITGRTILAGLATGTGFMVKALPVLVAPTALRVLPKVRGKAKYLLVTSLTIVFIALPFLMINPAFLLAPFVNMASRPPFETIWALLVGYYSGGFPLPLSERFDAATASVPVYPAHLPWLWISLLFAGLYLFLYTRPFDGSEKKTIALTGLTLCLFMIYSKGYSPQWLVYVLPFIILLLPNLRGVIYTVLLTLANFIEFPIALVVLPQEHWLLATAVIFRTALLALLCLEWGLILWPSAAIQQVRGKAFAALLAIALLGSPVVGVGALRAYRSERFNQDPYREAMAFLHSQPPAALLFTDRSLYLRFYPFMGGGKRLYLLTDGQKIQQRLKEIAGDHPSLWLVQVGEEGETGAKVRRWLSEQAFPVTLKWFSNCRLDNYATASITPFLPLEANFENLILLEGYALGEGPHQSGGVLSLALKWRALTSMDKDYTVFVHLLDPSGHLASQHDGQPVGGFYPTSSWGPGEEVIDRHGLSLAIPPGDYWLRVGLYEAESGERLQVIDEQGGEGVLIGPVTVTGGEDSEP